MFARCKQKKTDLVDFGQHQQSLGTHRLPLKGPTSLLGLIQYALKHLQEFQGITVVYYHSLRLQLQHSCSQAGW